MICRHASFKWKGKSCLDGDVSSCYLGHGDILVMDGQCQDEFLHRTDPGREQERINMTFRWIKQHASFCSFLKAGVACCLPTCAQGLSVPVMENALLVVFWGVFASSWRFIHRLLVLLASLYHEQNLGCFGVPQTAPFGRGLVGALPF